MSNAYAATPPNAMRVDALAGVRTRRILAVCIDLVLVSLLVAALWIVSIVLTFGLALLFISHDLAIVEHMTHRIAVMYLGKIVEIAAREQIFAGPKHPYTKALLSAVPVPDPTIRRTPIILKGDVPSPINPPSGCRFHTRCPFVFDRCRTEEPELRQRAEGQWAACHLDALPESQAIV